MKQIPHSLQVSGGRWLLRPPRNDFGFRGVELKIGVWLEAVGKEAVTEVSMPTLAGVNCCAWVVEMFLSWFSTGDLQFLQRALRLLLSSEHCVANLRLQPEQVVMVTPRFLEGMRKDRKWREIGGRLLKMYLWAVQVT